jgi:hypothetical protein
LIAISEVRGYRTVGVSRDIKRVRLQIDFVDFFFDIANIKIHSATFKTKLIEKSI